MLNAATIDRIFERAWEAYSSEESNPNDRDFLSVYLEYLAKEATLREDRMLPSIEAIADALRALPGDDKVAVYSNGINVVYPCQSFSVMARHPGMFILNAQQCHFSTDVTLWDPRDTAAVLYAAGHYLEKAGSRLEKYHEACKEKERIREIEHDFARKKDWLVESSAKLLANGTPEEDIKEGYLSLLREEAEKKGRSLQPSEMDRRLEEFLRAVEQRKSALLRNRRASEKRELRKKEDEARYAMEMQQLMQACEIPPVVVHRTPLTSRHFTEYRFPLQNGQTVSFNDYDRKSPARVGKTALTITALLQQMAPYLASKYRITNDAWTSAPSRIAQDNQDVLEKLGEGSPYHYLIESLSKPKGTVAFRLYRGTLICLYLFSKLGGRGLRFSLPLHLDPGQIEAFTGLFKEFIKFDRASRKDAGFVEYVFDVPEKK